MPHITNFSKKAIDTRKRVQFFRKVQLVLQERNVFDELVSPSKTVEKAQDLNFDSIESNKFTLRNWAITHRIKKRALSDLLKILRLFGFKWLPSDSRTFLKTPKHVEISQAAGGKLWYNGIKKSLSNSLCGITKDINISLKFNIDGMAPFKSSKIQLWPILMSIHGNENEHKIQIIFYILNRIFPSNFS